jgi:5-hydroxyisourate hydrolase-like protein (transthyretin family)
MKDNAIGQGFYKTMFEISHHYNKTLGSADVQFFLFLYVKFGMVLMLLTFLS